MEHSDLVKVAGEVSGAGRWVRGRTRTSGWGGFKKHEHKLGGSTAHHVCDLNLEVEPGAMVRILEV